MWNEDRKSDLIDKVNPNLKAKQTAMPREGLKWKSFLLPLCKKIGMKSPTPTRWSIEMI